MLHRNTANGTAHTADSKSGYYKKKDADGKLVDFSPANPTDVPDFRNVVKAGLTPWWINTRLMHTELITSSPGKKNFRPPRDTRYDDPNGRIKFGTDGVDISDDFEDPAKDWKKPAGWRSFNPRDLTAEEAKWIDYIKTPKPKTATGPVAKTKTVLVRKPVLQVVPKIQAAPSGGTVAKKRSREDFENEAGYEDEDDDCPMMLKKARFNPPRNGEVPSDVDRLLFFRKMQRLVEPTKHGQMLKWEPFRDLKRSRDLDDFNLPFSIPDNIPEAYGVIVNSWCSDHRTLRTHLISHLLENATEEEKELLAPRMRREFGTAQSTSSGMVSTSQSSSKKSLPTPRTGPKVTWLHQNFGDADDEEEEDESPVRRNPNRRAKK